MRVLLVNPKNSRQNNYVVIPSVGLGFIASALRKEGHEVRIVDCVRMNLSPSLLMAHLKKDPSPDLVGITFFTPAFSAVREYLKNLRQAFPHAFFVLGGPHPTPWLSASNPEARQRFAA